MARSPKQPKSSKQVDALKYDAASRKNIPTAEMESFFRRDEDASPMPPKQYPRARPLAEGATRTAEEPRAPELIWNGAKIKITEAQMKELAETGSLTLSDAQLVWRGKDRQDWSDLVVNVPPLYIQEKIHPKAIIDDLKRRTAEKREAETAAPDLFSDFNGIEPDQRAEFYQHDQHWSNRMILGDSLQVMASLAERESLRGKVQCIYFDPPYGIKFNSNWQVSTQSSDVMDGKQGDVSREPEQVKAFRDTWKDGIHSYLTYLRDRLTAMRDLLTESGSIFVQIGDENVHRVRAVLDEVFGAENFRSEIKFKTTGGHSSSFISSVFDTILWYSKSDQTKYRTLYFQRKPGDEGATQYKYGETEEGDRASLNTLSARNLTPAKVFQPYPLVSMNPSSTDRGVSYQGKIYYPTRGRHWSVKTEGTERIARTGRLFPQGDNLRFAYFLEDYPVTPYTNIWTDTQTSGFGAEALYVVQTLPKVIERCILMVTDPGDLVLDPTCGSGTSAYVAEQWGRRWITIDTSRVALALARTRLMAARYPWYLLADSLEGRAREADLQKRALPETPVHSDIRQGFVYERVPHITLKSIANNSLIDDIWSKWQPVLEPLRIDLNIGLGTCFEEWEIPRDLGFWLLSKEGKRAISQSDERSVLRDFTSPESKLSASYWFDQFRDQHRKILSIQYNAVVSEREGETSAGFTDEWIAQKLNPACQAINIALGSSFDWKSVPENLISWLRTEGKETLVRLHARWWEARISRQREIDASIAARADVEYLYDKPYTDNARVRVAGPFTVESLSPHRVLPASEEELIDLIDAAGGKRSPADADLAGQDFATIVIDYLKSEGVKQQDKRDRISFESLTPWPGNFIGASGTFVEGDKGHERRAAVLIGPEYGTVGRSDIIAAAREAVDARFDVLIACAFNFDAHSSELGSLGSLKILKARINPDMHMSDELKNTGRGNMFVVFGEPDVEILEEGGTEIRVKVNGVDVFDPNTGDIRSSDTKGIAAWFVDTDYNEESFFVRHAYFLGANDPYKSLKTALQAEIDEDAWATLYSDTSRPFPRPAGGRIAVKVINHFGDEVMKVFGV